MKNAVLVSLLVALCVSGCTRSTPSAVQPTVTLVKEHRCGTGRIVVGMTKQDVLKQLSGQQSYQANVHPSALQKRDSCGLIFGASKHGNGGFLNVYFAEGKVSKIEVIPRRRKQ